MAIPVEKIKQIQSGDLYSRRHAAADLGKHFLAHRRTESLVDYFELLAEADKITPGVADFFWNEVVYDCVGDDYKLAAKWVLKVLIARGPNVEFDMPKGDNNLRFHAHEMFDSDMSALLALKKRGFDDIIEMAIEHDLLTPEQVQKLR